MAKPDSESEEVDQASRHHQRVEVSSSAPRFDAFLSYGAKDDRIALGNREISVTKALKHSLVAHRHPSRFLFGRRFSVCRFEEDFELSESLPREIEKNIDRSDSVVVVASGASAESRHVSAELAHARSRRIPILAARLSLPPEHEFLRALGEDAIHADIEPGAGSSVREWKSRLRNESHKIVGRVWGVGIEAVHRSVARHTLCNRMALVVVVGLCLGLGGLLARNYIDNRHVLETIREIVDLGHSWDTTSHAWWAKQSIAHGHAVPPLPPPPELESIIAGTEERYRTLNERYGARLETHDYTMRVAAALIARARGNPERVNEILTDEEAVRMIGTGLLALSIKAGNYYEQEEWEEAVHTYTLAIDLQKDPSSDIYFCRARALYELGRYTESVEDYSLALKSNPDSAAALNNRGVAFVELADYEKAIADLDAAIALDPSGLAYSNRGVAHAEHGELDKAIEDYTKAIQLGPTVSALNNLGNAYAKEGSLDMAVETYEEGIAIDPRVASLHYHLGNALDGRGEEGRALAEYELALELQPEYADAHRNMGLVHFRAGRLGEAATSFNAALELRPGDCETRCDLGTVHLRQEQWSQALLHFERVIEIDPGFVLAHLNSGVAYAGLGRAREALEHYDEAIRLGSRYIGFFNRGHCRLQSGLYEKALEDFERAVECQPDSSKARHYRGCTHAVLNQLDRAVADFTWVIEHGDHTGEANGQPEPGFSRVEAYQVLTVDMRLLAHNQRGIAHARMGSFEPAIADFTRALEFVSDAGVFTNRGMAHEGQGNPEAALGDYSRAIGLDPINGELYYRRGLLRAAQGNGDLAREDLQRAVKLGVRPVQRENAQRELQALEDKE